MCSVCAFISIRPLKWRRFATAMRTRWCWPPALPRARTAFSCPPRRCPLPASICPMCIPLGTFFGLGAPPRLVGPAVVYDDTGSFEAISVADVLLQAGLSVTMVSRHDGIGAALPYPPVTVGAAKERLYSGDFDFIGGHYLRAIGEDSVEVGVLFTDRVRHLDAALVVLVGLQRTEPGACRGLGGSWRRLPSDRRRARPQQHPECHPCRRCAGQNHLAKLRRIFRAAAKVGGAGCPLDDQTHRPR